MTRIITAKAQRQADNVARQRLQPGLRAAVEAEAQQQVRLEVAEAA